MPPTGPDRSLAKRLLGGAGVEVRTLLLEAPRSAVEQALAELGRARTPAAAEVLDFADGVLLEKALRKAARRELHRLRSLGINPTGVLSASAAEATRIPAATRDQFTAAEARASAYDPSGGRLLTLLLERSLGGVWLVRFVSDERQGLTDFFLVDTTRKRARQSMDEDQSRTDLAWIDLPPDYALALLHEAVETARAAGRALPLEYSRVAKLLPDLPPPPERALVYASIDVLQVRLNPDWLEQSAALLSEPELFAWHVPAPESLRERAKEVLRAETSRLLVPGRGPLDLGWSLLQDASRTALDPSARQSLRRRLEETAYIFLRTDRLPAARHAVAAAQALRSPEQTLLAQPLLAPLLAAGLARLVLPDQHGGRDAAAKLIDLLREAVEWAREDPDSTPHLSGPGGLILPGQR